MRFVLLFLLIDTACAGYAPSQNSGYEMAEVLQPGPPVPPSAQGGDQQAYNTDVGAGVGKPRLNGRASAAGTTIGSYGIMQYISLNGLGPGFVPKTPGSNGNGFLSGGTGSNGGNGNGIPVLGNYNAAAETGTGYKNRRRLLYRLHRVQH
ncbi:unnamed protein product [Cylicostephanus goldi]|uniref:Uncharacterized protein n=1 Tax=Cylicostephanus goldi TaxID=71465 RepID=A0A3P6QTK0_CYLGO|nr:unnamed protein product [Cylicostephanus goldi]